MSRTAVVASIVNIHNPSAELSAPAAILFDEFDKKNSEAGDPLAGVTSRPDFVGIIYPGPTPFARNRAAPAIPRSAPPLSMRAPASR